MREEILQRIRQNKPQLRPLPQLPDFAPLREDLVAHFKEVAQGAAIEVLEEEEGITTVVAQQYPEAKQIVAPAYPELQTVAITQESPLEVLQNIDLLVLEAEWGVAENAALWLSEVRMLRRVLPFITQHLILVLPQVQLLANMHQAYARINLTEQGFGLFVAGPSKTADIEQSLVIGAQGARSLTVVLT